MLGSTRNPLRRVRSGQQAPAPGFVGQHGELEPQKEG
jgi:hypothetical protein